MNSIVQAARHKNPDLRFVFGRNWKPFLTTLDAHRIDEARWRLCESLGCGDLHGIRSLDVVSGSGLSRLVMHQLLGTDVVPFEYETDSMARTGEPDRPCVPSAMHWQFRQGSAFNPTIQNMDGQARFQDGSDATW